MAASPFPLLAALSSPPPRCPSAAVRLSPHRCRPRRRRPVLSVAVDGAGGNGDASEEELSRNTLLWRAAKLPIYSVALVPLTVASAAAYGDTGIFLAKRYFLLLASSVLVVTWLNLSNDVYDFDTGVDKDKKESVVNIIGSRRVVQIAAIISLLLGLTGLIWTFVQCGDIRFLLLMLSAIFCGYFYQCPPFRLSYLGLGEPLCFSAFGPFATTAFYFSNSANNFLSGTGKLLPLTGTIQSASFLVGLTTTLILFCSHFHQIDGDRAVGKMSPLVRLGTSTGSKVVVTGVLLLYALLLAFGFLKALPSTCMLLCALTIPMGKIVTDFVTENHTDKAKIFMAKYYCVRLHTLFGMALALGLVLARTARRT